MCKIVQSRCAKLLETYPERLTAVKAAKGDSNMYWLRGVIKYVNEINVNLQYICKNV